MDISNNQPTQEPRTLSVSVRIFCCVVLLLCSVALSALPFYIGEQGINPALPTAISAAVLVLGAVFALTLCKKPLFIGCAIGCALLLLLVSPWFSVLFIALLCATVATAALTADGRMISYLPVGIAVLVSFCISLALTRDPMLAAYVLLPVGAGFALSNGYQKRYSVIVTVGTATGLLLLIYAALLFINALLAGMQPSIAGVTEYIKAYHAAVSGIFAEAIHMMAEVPELAEQLAPMLGGEITAETVTAFSDSVSTAIMAILPGVAIMLAWIFSFTANRGLCALLLRGVDKKDYPVHLTSFQPSLPTAIFMVLCYAVLMIASFIPRAEVVVFISLNLLLALLPMMFVCGMLSIIANVKQAPVKWPLLLTYALSVIFLGIAVIPMVAFFGSFAVITNAIARALEKKFKDFQGGQ